MDLQEVLGVPGRIAGPASLRAHVVLRENSSGGEEQGEAVVDAFARRDIRGQHEVGLAPRESAGVQDLCALRRRLVARPLHGTDPIDQVVAHAAVGGRGAGDLVEDLRRVVVVTGVPGGVDQPYRDLPVSEACDRFDHLANSAHAAFGVGECAVFLECAAAGEEDVRVTRSFREIEILDDHALHLLQGRHDVRPVRVALNRVLSLNVHAAEGAGQSGIEHVGQAKTRFGVQLDAPFLLETAAHIGIGHEPVAREHVRPATEAAAALHVALAAQRIHAHALASEHAAGQCEVAETHHAGGALAVFGDAQTVVNDAVGAGGIQARGAADRVGIEPRFRADHLGAIAVVAHQRGPGLELRNVAAGLDESAVEQAFAHDDMRNAVEYGDVGAGLEGQMHVRATVRGGHGLGPTRVQHDELRPFADATLHERTEHGVAFGGVGPHHDDDIGCQHRVEVLACGARAEGCRQPELRRRMADAGTVVDVVVAQRHPRELLHEEDLFVGTAGTGHRADGLHAVARLDAFQLRSGVRDRLVPAHGAPGCVNALANHRRAHSVGMRVVVEGEAPLDTAVPMIRLAFLPGDHAYHTAL